jgi:hypothetical protein
MYHRCPESFFARHLKQSHHARAIHLLDARRSVAKLVLASDFALSRFPKYLYCTSFFYHSLQLR